MRQFFCNIMLGSGGSSQVQWSHIKYPVRTTVAPVLCRKHRRVKSPRPPFDSVLVTQETLKCPRMKGNPDCHPSRNKPQVKEKWGL